MLSQLSYWPWIIGGVVSFVAGISTWKRTVGELRISPPLALFGGGALAVILVGLIEASSTGIFVGRSIGDKLTGYLSSSMASATRHGVETSTLPVGQKVVNVVHHVAQKVVNVVPKVANVATERW